MEQKTETKLIHIMNKISNLDETFIQIKRNFDFENLDNNKNLIEELNQFDFTSFKNKNVYLKLIIFNIELDKEVVFKISIDQLIQLGKRILFEGLINKIMTGNITGKEAQILNKLFN
jgi:hypothetical protein